MDFFYDGQIRRYLTQFMRVFIGFKYRTDGAVPQEKHIPVVYGDPSRQVAHVIKENSENKVLTVPKIACYITSLELDKERLADSTFVSKLNIRERDYDIIDGERHYKNHQGGTYTIERLMPTPFRLGLKADIWTSSTEQKLQLLEQILVLFNPTLDLQMTDNYIDWTSLSVLELNGITFSSRSIPQGVDSEIDICSLEFSTPIFLNPPAKVKKLGVIKNIITNVFADITADNLHDLIYNSSQGTEVDDEYPGYGRPTPDDKRKNPAISMRRSINNVNVELIRDPKVEGQYICSIISPDLPYTDPSYPGGVILRETNWERILNLNGNYTGNSLIHFMQPTGYEISGSFVINALDITQLYVTLDKDTIPSNTMAAISMIIDPYKFNPIAKFGNVKRIPMGLRLLILDVVNNSDNLGKDGYDGPDAWKDLSGNDVYLKANSVIEWNGSTWVTTFDPDQNRDKIHYVTNLKTKEQFRWTGREWLKSFEGIYIKGFWRIEIDA